jgi:hypothetical protein
MGVEVLGAMAVGLGLSNQLWALAESLASQFLFPLFLKRISGASPADARVAYSDYLNVLGPVYVVVASANVVAASALLKLLIAPEYASVVLFVQLGALVELFRVLAAMLAIGMQVSGRMTQLVWPYMSGAVVLALLLMASNADVGPGWAGGALLVSLMLVVILLVPRARTEPGFSLDWKRWMWAASLLLGSICLLLALGGPDVQSMSFWQAVSRILMTAVAAVVATWLVLAGSPAASRFFNVRLRAVNGAGRG